MQHLSLSFLLFIISTFTQASYQDQISLCTFHTKTYHFLDENDKLTPEEALDIFHKQDERASSHLLNYGYTKGKIWLFIKTIPSKPELKCILELKNPQLDNIVIYDLKNKSPREKAQIGDDRPFYDRFYLTRNYVIPFDSEMLIGIKSTATMNIPFLIQEESLFASHVSTDYLLLGLFYGMMILFIFFGFHSFISFKNYGFLIYTFFAVSMLLFFMDKDGISFQYLWPHATTWKVASVRFFAAISMMFAVLYYSIILDVGRKTAFFCYFYVFACFVLATTLPFLDSSKTNLATIIISFGTPLFMIILPLSVLKNNKTFAPYLLFAGLFSFCGLLSYSLSVTDVIHSSFLTENAMKITTICEFLLLSLGIHTKIKLSLRKKALYKAVYEISNMLAHDVRKPLDKMSKFLKRLESFGKDEQITYINQYRDGIKEDIYAADYMLSDLIEMGKEKKISNKADISKLVSEATCEPYICTLNYLGLVKIDHIALMRILENITKNSRQATKNKSDCQYWIKTFDMGRQVKIVIGNTGSKIEAEDLPKVFDLFYTKGKANGSGIGLAYVEHAINQNGGSIVVESNGWSSYRKKVLPQHSEDYVEFQITLLKG